MDIGHAGFYVAHELELATVLIDFNGANFPRPLVHILKQVLVNGLKMSEVKISLRNTGADALRNKLYFCIFKLARITDAKFVFKNFRARINIRIIHSAA